MSQDIKELTSENFHEFIKEGNTVVDFWAAWCGPCRMMAPIFDQAAKELKGKVKFGKVNVDEESELAQEYEVFSIPTIVYFKKGKQVERTVGALSKDELKSTIEENLQ